MGRSTGNSQFYGTLFNPTESFESRLGAARRRSDRVAGMKKVCGRTGKLKFLIIGRRILNQTSERYSFNGIIGTGIEIHTCTCPIDLISIIDLKWGNLILLSKSHSSNLILSRLLLRKFNCQTNCKIKNFEISTVSLSK